MLPDRVSNPGPLTYESDALLIALRGPAKFNKQLSYNVSINIEEPAAEVAEQQSSVKISLMFALKANFIQLFERKREREKKLEIYSVFISCDRMMVLK